MQHFQLSLFVSEKAAFPENLPSSTPTPAENPAADEGEQLRQANNTITFLNERVAYLEKRNKDQMDQIENLSNAAQNLTQMGEKHTQLMENLNNSCRKIAKKSSKIKKAGENLLDESASNVTNKAAKTFMEVISFFMLFQNLKISVLDW